TPDEDKTRLSSVRSGDENSLADFHPLFKDPRLPELLLHYKAKNFPTSLSEQETEEWEAYRQSRLNRQAPLFLAELEKFKKSGADDFILEELFLWYESLKESDY
ncbi:exodeoxyribonuclease I, partial [Candidatus Saccharibacteria bacterium]|nr:exodeoxyribonuclease I [Candidatus Saccharibacteria bacterium]